MCFILVSSRRFILHISTISTKFPALEKFGRHCKTQHSLHVFEDGALFHPHSTEKYLVTSEL